jgi:hypothetical protein
MTLAIRLQNPCELPLRLAEGAERSTRYLFLACCRDGGGDHVCIENFAGALRPGGLRRSNCKTGVRPLSVEAAGEDARATLLDQQPCCSQPLGAANPLLIA